ncbi:uncharacterized protein [Arachis hypogaea]|uniref:uncharacterized protein n=1 Tax=Arachis hypogaea TaxID=3818 RepID=UPI003B211574
MNEAQRKAFHIISNVVNKHKGIFFFVYGYGRTSKSYLYKTLSAVIRSEGHIVLNVASSGIGSLLLPNKCTAHSRFKIPLDINENSICCIKQGSSLARFELYYNADLPFAGKVVVLGGDFRQILPVIPMGSCQEIVHALIYFKKHAVNNGNECI